VVYRARDTRLCWREGGPHKRHSVNHAHENLVNGSYRLATDAPSMLAISVGGGASGVWSGSDGSSYSYGSGDFAIAFSTSPEMRSRFREAAPRSRRVPPTDAVSPLFQEALEATEEAVYNALFHATTVSSKFGVPRLYQLSVCASSCQDRAFFSLTRSLRCRIIRVVLSRAAAVESCGRQRSHRSPSAG
jgi:peptidase S58-like protein